MSRNFIGSKIPTTKDERELLRKQAIEHPDFAPLFFSRDFKYGGIIVRTDFNGVPEEYNQNKDNSNLDIFEEDESFEDFEPIQNNENFSGDEYQPTFKITAMPEYSLFMKEINKILDNPKYLNELTFFPVGPPAIYSFYYDVVLPQMSMIMLGALIIIAVVLLFLFRAISAVVWSIFIIVLSIICTLGIIGWTGVVMNQMIQVVLFLIITIGVADTVHILSGYVYFRNLNQNHETALKSVFKKSGLACFLTSLTTAVGLISLIFVPIVPIKNFGIFSATGVFIAFIFTIFLLPLMLNLWAPVSKIEKKKRFKRKRRVFIQNILQNLEGYSIRYSKEIICLFFSMMIILLFGAYQVHVNYDIVKVLKDKAPIRNFYDIVDREMAGSGNMEILIETGKIYGMQDPS
ncbi:membrane protein containing MMPL domain protein, partial [Candidatus Magnetomorum sp. HK-1]